MSVSCIISCRVTTVST